MKQNIIEKTLNSIIKEYGKSNIKYITYVDVSKKTTSYGTLIKSEIIKENQNLFEEAGLVFESRSQKTDRRIIEIIEKMLEDGLTEISLPLVNEYAKQISGDQGMTRKAIIPRKILFEKAGLVFPVVPDQNKIKERIKEVYTHELDFSPEYKSMFIDSNESTVEYIKAFPRINFTGKYLILDEHKDSFVEFYSEAIREMLKALGKMSSNKLATGKLAKDIIERGAWEEISKLTEGKRVLKYKLLEERLIIQDNAHFKDLNDWEDYFSYIDGENPFPMRKNRAGKTFFKDMTKAHDLIAEFIIVPMVEKGMLLAPLYGSNLFYAKSNSVNQYISEQMYTSKRYIEIKEIIDNFFPRGIQKNYVYKMMLLSTTISAKDFTDDDLKNLKDYYKNNNIDISMARKTTKLSVSQEDEFGKALLVGLSKFFVKAGAKVDSRNTAKMKEKTFEEHMRRLISIQNHEDYKNNIDLIEQGKKFLKKIYAVDELMLSTMGSKISHLLTFYSFLIERFDGKEVTKEMMEDCLNFPDNDNTFQAKLKQLREKGRGSDMLISIQGTVIDFLDSTTEFYGVYKVNTRVKFKKVGPKNVRQSLDREVYDLILDIVMSRPPMMSKKKWGTVIVDWSDWWPHKVIPFLPLALYLHLYLPLRSSHILNLDRDNFLIKNSDGSIRSFWINTDKNTTKKEEHIIPNIYKTSLDIINKLIELNKEMYPELKKHKYMFDKNAPWLEFYPLFPNEHGDNIISKTMYKYYFSKVVMKAQMELIVKGSEKQIAWFKDGRDIPTTVDELENLTHSDISNIQLGFNLHSLRVTGATRLMQMGLPPQMIRYFTGHKNIDTLINIYIKIPHDELVESFFYIQDKIDTSSLDGLSSHHKSIPKVLFTSINCDNPKEVLKVLQSNHLFTMERAYFRSDRMINNKEIIKDGLSRVSEVHWSFWIPYTYGMCGKPDMCPFGAQVRCSLCPYLITGPMYLYGIAAKTEQLQVRIFTEANRIAENRKNGINDNQTLHKQQEDDLEELAGWYEILEKCEVDMQDPDDDSQSLPILADKILPLVQYSHVDKIDGLIHVYEQAKALKVNNRDVQDTIYMLSANIIEWCMLNDKVLEVKNILNKPEKLIEWFLPHKVNNMIEDTTMYLPN